MVFVGKLAYLVLFPGILFVVVAGVAARAVFSGIGTAVAGSERRGTAADSALLLVSWDREAVSTGGGLHAVEWLAPLTKVVALSLVSCIIFGFLHGDLVLVYALLLVAGGADLLASLLSPNPLVAHQARGEAASLLAWAVPFALALCAVALRSGEVSVAGLIRWQAGAGVLIASSSGGGVAQAGGALALLAAIASAIALMKLRPLGRSYAAGAPGALLDDVSGPPLAMFVAAGTAALFVVPMVLVTLFFAGPAAHFYQLLFWALKVLGIVIVLAVVDILCARANGRAVLVWGAGVFGLIGLVGLVLTWIGVSG